MKSEQVPSACALGVLVDTDQSVRAAGGYIIQLLPGADTHAAEMLEESVLRAGAVTAMLDEGMTPAEILLKILDGFSPDILAEIPVEYRCYCSESRISGALMSMGSRELRALAKEQEHFEITCQFCDRTYLFSSAQLLEMAGSGKEKE
jgi:molecular chaperone Hsp33